MATSAQTAYTQVVSPITANSARPGGDNIAISFTKGKKSTQEQLDELAIQRAQAELQRLALVPITSEQQRYSWEAENQRLAEEAAAREATETALQIKATESALASQQLALEQAKLVNPLELQARTLELEQSKALAPGALSAQQAQIDAQRASTALANQSLAQGNILNPIEAQTKQHALTTSKAQAPIQTATMQASLAALNQQMVSAQNDELYRQQAYKDTHLGMTPTQVNSTKAANAQRYAVTSATSSPSAAQQQYDIFMGYKPYGTVTAQTSSNPNYPLVGYVQPTGGGLPQAIYTPTARQLQYQSQSHNSKAVPQKSYTL